MEKSGKFVDLRTKTFMEMVGSILADRYELHNLLGSGGMGAVFRGTQKAVGRHVAVKVLPRIDPLTAARFQREARTVSKLSHPNTITVFDFGQSEEGYLFLVMEYLEGRTLRDLIKDTGALPPRRAVHIVHQICRSLSEAHAEGIVHRDIKPDNIFLIHRDDDPDFIKVLDFGIAKAMYGDDPDDDITQQGRIVGTPRYMSPEQVLGLPVDHRADIYSLGIILYQLLTGGPPFDDSSTAMLMMKHAHEMPPPLAEKLPPEAMAQMPAGLEAVVMKAISKRPETRQQTIDMLRTELELVMPSAVGVEPRTTGSQPVLGRDDSYPGGPFSPPTGGGMYSTPDPSSTSNPNLYANPMGHPSGQWTSPQASGAWATVPSGTMQAAHAAHSSQMLPAMQGYPSRDDWAPPQQNSHARMGVLLIALGAMLLLLVGASIGGFLFWQSQQKPPQTLILEDKPAAAPVAPRATAVARITIQTRPTGATVMANGESIGITPMVVEVPRDRGEISYTLSLDGHESMTRQFVLQNIPTEGDTWSVELPALPAPEEGGAAAGGEDKPQEATPDQEEADAKAEQRRAWRQRRAGATRADKPKATDKVADKGGDKATPAANPQAPAETKKADPPKAEEQRKPRIQTLDAAPASGDGAKKPKVKLLE